LRLDNHAYSPTALYMIAEAQAKLHSAKDAAYALNLAGIEICSRHVQRIAGEIGRELQEQRDNKTIKHRRRELPARVAAAPEVVAVEVDGGRLRTRAADCGPGVHDFHNKEDKIACLVSLKSEVHETDPQPEPPESFLLPRRVQRLVQQMKGMAADNPEEEVEQEDASTPAPPEVEPKAHRPSPRRHVRTCVASMADCQAFGPMMAAEAQERDFYQAKRRAFLGDGAHYNWGIQRAYFADFEPITDFLHVLCYVYKAAWGVGVDDKQRWAIYVKWMTACWEGRVKVVIAEFGYWQDVVGKPPEGEELPAKDPRKLVAEALNFLQNNQERMDYPRYRKEGLPITSSLVESLVGEFNARVKSKQMYWNNPAGAEAILQLRAAVLSEDDRLERYFTQRPGNPYRRRKPA
jgi:hypothetical protein